VLLLIDFAVFIRNHLNSSPPESFPFKEVPNYQSMKYSSSELFPAEGSVSLWVTACNFFCKALPVSDKEKHTPNFFRSNA
jgi:hypothetical protein